MKAAILALSLAAALPVAGLSTAAGAAPASSPVLDTVWSLCAPNHARAAQVLAAADSSGWGALSAAGKAQAEGRFSTFPASFREKTVDGVRLLLVVGESPEGDGNPNQRRRCWVESGRANSAEPLTGLRTYFGTEPNVTYQTTSGWAYFEVGGRRTFVKDGDPTPAGADTMKLVMTSSAFQFENVGYNESGPQ